MPREARLLHTPCWCGKAHVTVIYRQEIQTTTFVHGSDKMDVLDSIMLQSGLAWAGMVDGFLMTIHQRDQSLQTDANPVYQLG